MLLIAYGTRPEYIKILPIIKIMDKMNLKYKTLYTGQHEDIVFNKADFVLKMKNYGDNRLDNIIQNCLNLPDEWFYHIDHILLQGDTTSVVGLSLAAMHRKINVIHLEAGLRTYDNDNPFPEENNRKIVSTISKIHLCPTQFNSENLKKENIVENVYVVGNTVLDNLVELKDKLEYKNKILVTLHRRENHETIKDWFNEINNLAKEYSEYEFVLPIHPNPNVQKFKNLLTNVNVVNPMTHDELLNLLIKTKLVITDSGGIQEECSFFNKKCLVCRKTTERPESLGLTSFIVTNSTKLKDLFCLHINNFEVNYDCPYGDGFSAEKIIKIIIDHKIC